MVKDSTRKHLLLLYQKYGEDIAIETARKSLSIAKGGKDFKPQFNGEICETVLEIILKEYCKKHQDSFYLKSVVLPDTETLSNFLTEIDFVFFTTECIYCIECKSYAGDKELCNEGTIVLRNGKSRDVYKQNSMHLDVLDKLIGPFSKEPVYKLVLFNFSTGNLIDKRTDEWKMNFPVVDEKNFRTVISKRRKKVWDVVGLRRASVKIEKFSDANRARHLEYVKKLHGGN